MTKCNCGSGLETDYEDRHGCAACRRTSTQAVIDAAKYAVVREGQRVRLTRDGDRVVVSEMLIFNKQDWEWVPAHPALAERFPAPVIFDTSSIRTPITARLPPPQRSTFAIDREATGNMMVAHSRNTDDFVIPRACAYEHGRSVEGVRQRRWGVGATGEEPDERITSDPQWYYWPDGADFPWRPLGKPTIDELCRIAMWLRWLEVQRVVLEQCRDKSAPTDADLLASAEALDWQNPEIRYLGCAPEQGGRLAVAVEALPGKIPTRSGIRLRFREEMTVERDAANRVRVIDDYAVHVTPGLMSYRPV